MSLLVLDTSLRTVYVVDNYNSLIWTDRYQEAGDFELYTAVSEEILTYIRQDYYLWNSKSDRIMIIEKIQVTSDSEEGNRITVTGRSLESILDRRIVWGLKTVSGSLQDAVESLLNENFINPSKPERKIENFVFQKSTDPQITGLTIETQYTGDNIYDILTKLCSERGIGFRVRLNNLNQFVFELYVGTDHSYKQFANPYVIFSPKFDNMINGNYMESKSAFKNVTLIGGEGEGTERRYTAVGNTAGLERREIFTDARDLSSDSDTELTEEFDFTQYPNQAFNDSSKSFVSTSYFNSAMIDLSPYIGRTLSVTIPKVSNTSGSALGYSTILVDSSKNYISTLQKWEPYDDSGSSSDTMRGSLETYEILIPENAGYLYTSMFTQYSIDNDIYYGELDDFACSTVKVSDNEYIAMMRQRGKETLSENQDIVSFEGQAETSIMFQYGTHFGIGDIVQVADEYGHESEARVTEIIISEDDQGILTYPTFSTIVTETGALPEGYIYANYIQSTGTQYINTGYVPNENTRIVMEFELLSTEVTGLVEFFGCSDAGLAFSFGYRGDSLLAYSASIRNQVLTYGHDVPTSGQTGVHTVAQNMQWVTIDEIHTKNVPTTAVLEYPNLPLYLFASNVKLPTAGVSNPTNYSVVRCYRVEIYEGDLLVSQMVPCKNENEEAGLYDIIRKQFYENAGTGTFLVI